VNHAHHTKLHEEDDLMKPAFYFVSFSVMRVVQLLVRDLVFILISFTSLRYAILSALPVAPRDNV
jgi:hypothetical protein